MTNRFYKYCLKEFTLKDIFCELFHFRKHDYYEDYIDQRYGECRKCHRDLFEFKIPLTRK